MKKMTVKKLVLNKESISGLDRQELRDAQGGGTGYPCATYTCVDTKCFC